MENFIKIIDALGTGKIITLFIVLGGLIVFFMFITTRLTQPQMSLLYSDLEPSDASTIIDRLQAMNIPYQLRNDGRTVFAASDQITQLRVTLAGEGLGGSIVGNEIFDREDNLGTTSFVQNINKTRAIEGELARTIAEINNVASARVHIVMPERQLFSQSERSASAAIVLKTSRGGLNSQQVSSIQQLVAASVEGLDPQRISIVDQRGTLLARGAESSTEGSLSANFEERQRATEGRYRNQIESLLERIVGPGHARAEVAVEMNVNRRTINSETFDPDTQVVLSSTTSEDITQTPVGDANQGVVTVAGADPNAPAQPAGQQQFSTTNTTSETTNFENSKSITTEIQEGGEITKVSVAVLLDGNYTTDANGNQVYQPQPQAVLDNVESLVQSAIGYDANRGDVVQVVNMQFAQPEEAPPPPEPFNVMGLSKDDLSNLLELLVIGIISILVLLLVVRPLVTRIIQAIPDPAPTAPIQIAQSSATAAFPRPEVHGITPQLASAAASGDSAALSALQQAKESNIASAKPLGIETQIDVASVEGRVQDSALKKVGDIVMRHPEESAAIVRGWLYSD